MEGNFSEARTYENNQSSMQREYGHNLINLLCLEKGSKVLDLGCGTGHLTKALADRTGPKGKVVGMDPNTERLQLAKEKYSAPNLAYQEGIAKDIPGDNYDAVFSNFVLHWCEDKDAVFKQVKRCLKEGGKFGFATLINFNVAEQYCTPADMLSVECSEYIISMMNVPSTKDILNLIAANGYRLTYLHEDIREWKFENVSKLIEFFMTHFSDLGRLGRHHYNVEAMKRHYGDGEIVFKHPITTVVCVKQHVQCNL